jgi:hypothetical protein
MRIRYNNIKVDINDTRFIFRLILSLQHGQNEIFGKTVQVILHKNKKISLYSRILYLKFSEEEFRAMIFIDWLVQKFLNFRIDILCLKTEKRLFTPKLIIRFKIKSSQWSI